MECLSAEIMAQMQEAAGQAMSNVRDREAMKAACAEMDRISEEIRKKHGVLDLGGPAIRQLRESY